MQKKDDEDELLLSIFKQIHINLPFLEAMIQRPKGSNVQKDLLLQKEKLKKAASSVKLSEECSAIIQRSLPRKEGNPGIFTLPYLIRPLAVDFVVLEMDEDELVLIILGQPFLIIARDVSKYSRNNYLHCVDHTTKLVQEQWVDTIDHDGTCVEAEEDGDPNEVHAVSFYPGT
uniref:Reverse transcriptase domain-containing protein n=1 Tax=Tanacetum cinerariifolium TaxID=118510 RepID=A0A6L2NS20_TANCI|nr:hypothetical protein [Tanacetum cinerariifolium]